MKSRGKVSVYFVYALRKSGRMPANENSLAGQVHSGYTLLKRIGAGSFGVVYSASKGDKQVAIKLPEGKDGCVRFLEHEISMYKCTKLPHSVVTIDSKKCLVMPLHGKNLEQMIETHGKFSLKNVLLVAINGIRLLKEIHSKGVIHRDVKPGNFALGTGSGENLYLIDLGLSKKYIGTRGHCEMTNKDSFRGTTRYASINAHDLLEQSRRDDLESLAYTLVYLFKGSLPWQSRGIPKEDRNEYVKKIKKETSVETLCADMPREFEVYLRYIKTIDFTEKPPYTSFITMFTRLYSSRGYIHATFSFPEL